MVINMCPVTSISAPLCSCQGLGSAESLLPELPRKLTGLETWQRLKYTRLPRHAY